MRSLLGGQTLYLVDRRTAMYLQLPYLELPAPGLTHIPAARSESCTRTCAQHALVCAPFQMPFVNSCGMLRQHFKCEAGCGHQVGLELPCYVIDPQQVTYHQCLTSDEAPTNCDASHPSTRRICACLPR